MEHRNITGLDALHPFTIRQAVDPGAVGADKGWLDTSTDPPTLRVRNATNTGWDAPQATAVDQLPLVQDRAARDITYPVPSAGRRVFNRGTRRFERDNGVAGARRWSPDTDAPVDHVTPRSFAIGPWWDVNGVLQCADGAAALRYVTAPEIAAHPEWIGKYLAGVHTRDDVLWCEAIYAACSNHPNAVKARGTIATVVDHGGGVIEYGFVNGLAQNTLDGGNAPGAGVISANAGLVSVFPLVGAGGLYNEGMRGAMLMAVDGKYPFVCHMVQDNTATSVTTNENLAPPTGAGGDYRLSVGDHVEIIQFHGSGPTPDGTAVTQYTRRVELGPIALKLTRGAGIAFTVGFQMFGFGQLSTRITMTAKDMPGIVTNGLAYSHFEGFLADRTTYSNRPWFDIDQTGFKVGNSSAAASSQQNSWDKVFFGGYFDGNFWEARGGTSYAAPVALKAPINTDPGYVTLAAPVALKLHELRHCWMVIKASADKRKIGMRFLVSSSAAAALGADVRVTLYFPFPTAPVQPAVGDTVYFECGDSSAIDFGAGKVYVNGSDGPQGSENMIEKCFAGGFANWAYGSLTGNALQQSLKGGNIGSCPNWGVFSYWGNWSIDGTGFQSGTNPIYNQYTMAWGDPTRYGFDILINNAVFECSTIVNCRSESQRLLSNGGAQFVTCLDSGSSGQIIGDFPLSSQWEAGKAVRTWGTDARVMPTFVNPSFTVNRTGGFFVAAQVQIAGAGAYGVGNSQTSAVEPVWANAGLAWPGVGFKQIIEPNAGAAANDNILWMGIDSFYSWLHNFTDKGFRAIDGYNMRIDNFRTRNLRISTLGNDIGKIETDRADWIGHVSGDFRKPESTQGTRWRIRGPVVHVPPHPAIVPGWGFYAGAAHPFDTYPNADFMGSIDPILWTIGKLDNNDQVMWQGGIGPGARKSKVIALFGRHQADGAAYGAAILSSPAPRVVKPNHSLQQGNGTRDDGGMDILDAPGRKMQIGMGLGIGAGAPAPVEILRAVPNASGYDEQLYAATPILAFDGDIAADETGVLITANGAQLRVKVGAAGSGPGGVGRVLYAV
jgi:hypothetical protein